MTSSCILGSVRVENSRKSEFLCFYPICLKFGMEGDFEMMITKRRPKWKLENVLNKKGYNFLPILTKVIPSTLQQ